MTVDNAGLVSHDQHQHTCPGVPTDDTGHSHLDTDLELQLHTTLCKRATQNAYFSFTSTMHRTRDLYITQSRVVWEYHSTTNYTLVSTFTSENNVV